jgi:hypothetical protein
VETESAYAGSKKENLQIPTRGNHMERDFEWVQCIVSISVTQYYTK